MQAEVAESTPRPEPSSVRSIRNHLPVTDVA